MTRRPLAMVVVLAGVSAALHVGKLPPAIPVLRDALGVTLLQAGFLLSFVQLAGMALGLVAGLAADVWGLRRSLLTGLLVLSAASVLGAFTRDPATLLGLRAIEGVGLLLATLPAPGLLRRLVPSRRLPIALGFWSTYMPLGTALALASGPLVIAAAGWPSWWIGVAAVSFLMAGWVWRSVPPDPLGTVRGFGEEIRTRVRETLRAPDGWLVALAFAMYSAQWLAVVGFLPSIYSQAGWSASAVGLLTAVAAAVNIAGNLASGRALAKGVPPYALLCAGFIAMALGATVAFASAVPIDPAGRYLAILGFSMLGGLVPATLFSLAVRAAPHPRAVSTTVGWVQQWSALGQFAGPPMAAYLAGVAGGWHWTWLFNALCSAAGIALALVLRVRLHL